MPNYSIDAIKIAKAIQKDELSILRGKEFKMSGKIKKRKRMKKTRRKRKITLSILAERMEAGFKRIDTRIDNLENDINARLDYIVKANNLKDSK